MLVPVGTAAAVLLFAVVLSGLFIHGTLIFRRLKPPATRWGPYRIIFLYYRKPDFAKILPRLSWWFGTWYDTGSVRRLLEVPLATYTLCPERAWKSFDVKQPNASKTYEIVHAHLLWWLLAAYALGAFFPGLGIWIRGVFPDQLIPGDNYSGGLLKGMLAVLLFNAGLGIDLNAVKQMGRRLALLFVMPVVGFVAPAIYLVVISLFMSESLSPEMVYALLFGVAVVGAMPSAASSTGWAQTSGGNMAISCGLVVTTTLFSPLSVWLMLGLVGWLLPGSQAFPASTYSTVAVIALWGLVPMGIGMAARQGIGNDGYDRAKTYIKLTTIVVILLLNYTNASLSLPRLVKQPDWWSVSLITLVMLGLCVVQYVAARPMARLFRTEPSERTSLYFSTGMRNNGAGLVLITSCMAQYEVILLPVIIYTLIQHLAAGVINRVRRKAVADA